MGARLRVNYEGRLNLAVDVDLQKLVGIDKLTLHANMFQIHGDGLSRSNLQNFFVVSGIEPLPSTRLYEAYFEKQWGAKKVSLKFGQIAADSEFFNTKYTDVFTNASMGWPAITSLDRGIGVFTRVAGAPADRNLIDLYADAGIEFIGLRDYRPDDKFGIAAGYAHVSKRAQALDADYRTLVHSTRGPDETPSREDALRLYTVGSAWFCFDETRRGTLETGKLADFAILDRDFMSVPVEQIGATASLLTVVGGKVVYAADVFSSAK